MKNYAYYDSANIKNLKELVTHVKEKWGAKDLFRSPNPDDEGYTGISFVGFAADIDRVGTALCSANLAGKRIAVMGNNCYGWALAYFAVVNSGGCAVPVDPELSIGDICEIITKTQTEALFYTSSCDEKIEGILNACPDLKYRFCLDMPSALSGKTIFDLAADGQALMQKGDNTFSQVKIDNNSVCAIIYTSGTTGTQKGVMLSNANLAANITAAVKMVHFDKDDVFLSVLPYHHTYECTCGLMIVMLWGGCICFNDSIRNISKNLVRFSPTAMLLVPLYIETFYKKIIDNIKRAKSEKKFKKALKISSCLLPFGIDLRHKLFSKIIDSFGGRLKTVICGGAYLRPDYVKLFRQLGIQILQGYGITECSPLVAVNRNKCWKYDSVGMPIPCCDVKIEGGEKTGEILIKGDNVMLGYFGDAALTAASFTDGWYKSGDIGYVDKKKFIYITGRKANRIVFKNGKNVAPEEMESELTKNDIIKEIVIVARNDKDGVRDLFAYVKCNDEFTQNNDSLILYEKVGKIIGEFNSRQPLYKHIRDFALIQADFPKTTSKKIIRYRVGDDNDV